MKLYQLRAEGYLCASWRSIRSKKVFRSEVDAQASIPAWIKFLMDGQFFDRDPEVDVRDDLEMEVPTRTFEDWWGEIGWAYENNEDTPLYKGVAKEVWNEADKGWKG